MKVWVDLDWPYSENALDNVFISPLRLSGHTDGTRNFYPVVEVPDELVTRYDEAMRNLNEVVSLIQGIVSAPAAVLEIDRQYAQYWREERERRHP